jgi:hypothetical protein
VRKERTCKTLPLLNGQIRFREIVTNSGIDYKSENPGTYLVILRDVEWHNGFLNTIVAQDFRAPVPIFTRCLEKEKYM